jgi:2-methylcitrate dehydratase
MAAFANGVMLRYLDCNDSYFSPGGGHPSDMIPAALALAAPLERDGPMVIAAIVLAYEVFCRLSDQVVAGDLGWDQGVFAVIGAACAAGKILGLDQDQMGHAISLSVVPNLPLGVTRTGELSMWKGCATASAVRAGVFAAQLAGQGMTGPPEPFEGRRGLWPQAVGRPVSLKPLGGGAEPWRILNTTFKSYPSQIHTQGPIGLALELRPKLRLEDIESIVIQAYQGAASDPTTEPEKWDPKTRETADHSIPFLVATALQYGAVTPSSFTQDRIQSPDIHDLISKMVIRENEEFTQRYPAEYGCRMEITERTGKSFMAETSHPKGHRLNPLSDSEVEAKFRSLASAECAESQCQRIIETAWALDKLYDLNILYDTLVV